MNINDLLKLARSGYFNVFRTRNNLLEIKRLIACATPMWKIWVKEDNEDSFRHWYDIAMSNPNALDATKKFTATDLDRIQEQGFNVIRKCNIPSPCIKQRKKDTRRWIIVERFKKTGDRDQRLFELLQDNHTVLI